MAYRKRAFDILFGSALAMLALPLVILLAICSAVALRAWPFFVQDRVGRYGRSFRIPKIRSLPASTPAYADKYEIATVDIPPLCAWMRRCHLDELPQLFLVPFGRMSLVGPRPEMAILLTRAEPEFVRARSLVRPGCTGLWQIGARTGALINEAPGYDLHYLGFASLRLDCWVLWQTLTVMFFGSGPVEPQDVPSWLHGWGLVPSREFVAVVEQRVEQRVSGAAAIMSEAGIRGACPAGPAVVSVVSVTHSGVHGRQPSRVAS